MVNFVYCSDENYAPYVGVSMLSLLENNCSEFDEINIYIIHENMSKDYMSKIDSISKDYDNVKVNFYKFDIENIGDKSTSNYPQGMLYRLFLPTILPNIDKIIYLDVDSIIFGSFKELTNIDIDNYYFAAVNDFPHYKLKKKLNLEGEKYFNSGFLYINLNKFREDNLEQKFIQELNKGNFIYVDQDILNVVCRNKILPLPPKYNFYSFFLELGYETVSKCYNFNNNYFSKEEIENASQNVVFNHFLCLFSGKPWNYSTHPLYDVYKNYAERTPFDNKVLFKPMERVLWQRILLKIINSVPTKLASFLIYIIFRLFFYEKYD